MIKKKNDIAVNDIVGTVMLLGMAVLLFSVLTFVVMSYPFNESASSVNIVGTLEGNNIILEHRGGESLNLDTTVIFSIGGVRHSVIIGENDYLNDEFKQDGKWNLGENLVFSGVDLTDKNVEVCVVEEKTKSVIMQGFLQGGSSSIPPLDTHVDTIKPYLTGSSSIYINATGSLFLDNVKLYYNYSADNETWTEYDILYDTEWLIKWQWEFTFPEGPGYYSFYSVGKYGVLSEDAPVEPDAICYFNPAPKITYIYPTNNAVDVPILPVLTVTVSDPNDYMDITWFSNSTGSWEEFGTNYSVNDGIYQMINNDFNCYKTEYCWYVSITDGVNTVNSSVYHFTTEEINTFVNSLPAVVTSSSFGISANGPSDLDSVTLWYRYNNGGGWTTLTYDDFEQGWGNYKDGGDDCDRYYGENYAHQGNYAAHIQDNNGVDSSFYYPDGIDVDTPGYVSITIDFWFKARGMEPGEDFWVRYYDGNDWETVADYDSGDEFVNLQFYHEIVWINETEHDFPTNMKIRFQCDANWNSDDVYIDQIYVNATDGLGPSDYTIFSTDYTSSSWQWSFNFPEGEGYYEFYSIGKKNGSPDENTPIEPDAYCYYNPGG